MHRTVIAGLLAFSSLLACKGSSADDTATGGSSDTTSPGASSTDPQTSTNVPDPTTAGETTATGGTITATGGETLTTAPDPTTGTSTTGDVLTTAATTTTDATTDATSSGTTGGGGPCVELACEGTVYACGDCVDNDGDGKVDGADPECISPCDDQEDTFATGLPGDNMDPCKQDCFFDGNSGGGPGDCAWDLKCDPASPGGDKCPYDPDFNNCPADQSDECIMNCQVPNGCDCFGCCTVEVDGMSYDIYLGDPDCALANIDSCSLCSKNDDCDEECVPENCEVCFGMELPPECEDPTCDVGEIPCEVDDMGGSNCPVDMFCNTGCCAPLVPN